MSKNLIRNFLTSLSDFKNIKKVKQKDKKKNIALQWKTT